MTFKFINAQDLFKRHAARLAEIGNDLKALIGYVKENGPSLFGVGAFVSPE